MKSTVTTKYQTTIPKTVREFLGIAVNDALEWTLERGKVIVYPVRNDFLKHCNSVKIGPGDITEDIRLARSLRAEKHL
jgi:AbrB family looped-hinge helix DNA binding protein